MAHKVANFDDACRAPTAYGTSRFYRRHGKRFFDISLSIFLLPLALLILAVLVIAARFSGGRPFYFQERIGRNGRVFRCYKVRTMVPNAENLIHELCEHDPEIAAEWARDRKLRNDPRITRLGRVLRKTSLDELPQLWNVLKGDMSLVGPRPVIAEELVYYGAAQESYLAVRPGVTGYWQVSGRNDVSYASRVQMDRVYVRRHSLAFDLAILVKTLGVVVNRTGK
ncbi:sugar transferase [Roseisalinus antarcticus]|uniref:Putative sugar transferase EpsL n=1 Tax=Roseisalinus antarcticus TaxID=254357 RepID=A0A1Y5S7C9_9RHOB|nr:sugar transferase [Roseisalinus antarcticus]SLN34114.1 putative sugar transferase EpsL [Roseisalinus antarcticus]